MQRFVSNPVEIEAFRYDGDYNALVAAINPVREVFTPDERALELLHAGDEPNPQEVDLRVQLIEGDGVVKVYIRATSSFDYLYPGKWLVREGENGFRIVTDAEMRMYYRPVVEDENDLESQAAAESESDLRTEMTSLLNRFSVENQSGTPDFVLADVALRAIEAFNDSVVARAGWRGESWAFEPWRSIHPSTEQKEDSNVD